MRSILTTLSLALCAACSSGPSGDDGTEATLEAYETALAALSATVSAHGEAVAAAADFTEAGALEATYADDWASGMEELQHAMDDVEGCSMDDEGMEMMDEAMAGMMSLDEAVEGHVDAHPAHADLADCLAEEGTHGPAVTADLDTMMAHHDHWHDSESFACEMHGGGHD